MPFDWSTLFALLVLAAMILAPGYALARSLSAREPDPLVRAGLAAGAGLALWPVLALWLDTVGLPYGPAVGMLALVAIVAPSAVRLFRSGAPAERGLVGREPGVDVPSGAGPSSWRHPATIAGVALLVFLLAARWWAARGLTVPLWGDSVHHAMIVRLFDAQGGLPESWLPFAPLATFTYHFGLHALTSLVAQISGLPAHRALIVVGQSLMVLQALTAYALVAGLTGRRWAGFGAALAAAGLGTMPGFYLNWGRYTQLAGQVLLPVAGLAVVRVAAEPMPPVRERMAYARRLAFAALLVAGLALTHYLVSLFFLLFVFAWLIVGGVGGKAGAGTGSSIGSSSGSRIGSDLRSALARRARALPPLSLIAGGGVLLAAPWIPRFLGGRLDNHAAALLTTELPDERVWGLPPPSYVWGNLSAFVGWPLVAAAVLGMAWTAYRAWRERGAASRSGSVRRVALLGLVWAALLLIAAYPALIGLPITGPLKDFTVFIALYLPFGLMVAALAVALADGVRGGFVGRLETAPMRLDGLLVLSAVLLVALVTVSDREVIEDQHILATAADERAMDWIAANTPADAAFLVSAGPAYGDTVVAGEDGGWWLSQLADRRSTLPPITYGLEPGIETDWRQQVNALNAAWRADLDGAEAERLLREEGVGWAYVGPNAKTLTVEALERSPDWERVYAEDGASVYRAVWVEGEGR